MASAKTVPIRHGEVAHALPVSAVARARQLEQVLEQIGEAIIVKDLDAVVTYWNREAASLYGFSAEDAIGRPLRKLHAADLSEAEYARLLERVRSGKPTTSTTERRKKSGDAVRVAIKTTPLLDAQGRLIGEITIARDVTALHRTEEALRAAQATLEARLTAIRESNRNLKREVGARRKTERAQRQSNRALAAMVRQLEAFHRAGEALSRMTELLQSCSGRDEAYAAVRQTATELFPDVPGTLYIYRESRDALEQVAAWGGKQPAEALLVPDECWALRLGRPHVARGMGAIRCRHADPATPNTICMPVQGQGQVVALLHLALSVAGKKTPAAALAERRLRALTDRLGPALANLKLRDALRVLALNDSLTGLYNRRYLEDALNRELARAERSKKPFSIIMIDIDHFKRFNDTFGHDAGDFVLTAIARALVKNVRPTDIVCRYGGEELAVVLAEADLAAGLERAEKLRVTIRETNLTHRAQTLPGPSASFGVATYPQHGTSIAEVLKAADQALYRAKQSGRDQVCAPEEALPATSVTQVPGL